MAATDPPALAFTHTRLLFANYRDCFRFYRDVLGLDVAFGDEDSGYADFRTGETSLALFDRAEMAEAVGTDESPSAAGRDVVVPVFRVESVDDAYERLRPAA